MEIIERIQTKLIRDVDLYKIGGMLYDLLEIRGADIQTIDDDNIIYSHALKFVKGQDGKIAVYDMSSERETQICNVWLLCIAFTEIYNMEDTNFFDAPEWFWARKHAPH